MKPGTRVKVDGKPATITGEYDDGVPGYPPGYYYQIDGQLSTHWISVTGVSLRVTMLDPKDDPKQKAATS